MLTVGAFRSPHRSPIKLASFLASMNCLPTPHYLPEMTAKHSTLIRETRRVPGGPPTALEMSAQTQTSGHVHSRLTSSMHNQRLQQKTCLFKVLFGNSFFKMALEGYVGLEGCYISRRPIRPPAESKALATAPRGTPMHSIQGPIGKQTTLLNQKVQAHRTVITDVFHWQNLHNICHPEKGT